ncbi:MAG: hypothetical protein RL292_515 [Candidatus Parcubacteria bacterium]|jgi:hypothetical protein
METTKKSLLIFLALIIVGGSAYGAFYLLKKYIKKSSDVPAQNATTTAIVIPGFKQESVNKVPAVFPKGLIAEKNIIPIESFTVKTTSNTQYTYRYVTKLSFGENYSYFFKTVRADGWEVKSVNKIDASWFMDFSKGRQDLSISYSLNTQTKEGIIDVTFIQKNNE